MTRLIFLPDEKRTSRPTLVEILDILRCRSQLCEGDRGLVKLCPSPTSLRRGAYCGVIEFTVPAGKEPAAVQLPTSARFDALSESGSEEQHPMARLDGAEVWSNGLVIMVDGMRLRGLRFRAEPNRCDPTSLEWQIILGVIKVLGAERTCIRSRSELQPELCQVLAEDLEDESELASFALSPELDFAAIRRLSVRSSLEKLLDKLAQSDLALYKLSRQKLSDTLAMFGVRIPARRPGYAQTNS